MLTTKSFIVVIIITNFYIDEFSYLYILLFYIKRLLISLPQNSHEFRVKYSSFEIH